MEVSRKDQLMQMINAASFAVNDINLYLDTHPTDMQALEYYNMYRDMREQAVKSYTEFYGPLTADMVLVGDRWTWIDKPWPWEGNGGC